MNELKPASDERPVCPRCDHDLRGERLAWRDACPLRGRCSECALAFAWGDLLSGRLHYPRWSTEGAEHPLAWAGRAGRQLLVTTVRPRRALVQLRLEHGIRPKRLAAGLLLPLLLLAVVLVLIAARGFVDAGVGWSRAVWGVLSSPPSSALTVAFPTPRPGELRVATRVGAAFTLIDRDPAWGPVPTIDQDPPEGTPYQILPHPRIEVRSADGGRVLIEAPDGPMTRRVPGEPQQEVWYYRQAWLENGRKVNGITMTYPSPGRSLLDRLDEYAGVIGGFVMPLALSVPVSVVGFVVLPIARRQARVRWAHLLRLTVLAAHGSLGLLLLMLVLGPLTGVVGPAGPGVVNRLLVVASDLVGLARVDRPLLPALLGLLGLPILLGATWWTWAARHYLRMERPVLVGLSAAAVSWLTFVVVVAVVLFATSSA